MYQYNSEQAIRDYVERTFAMYDMDQSQTLDINEFARYLQDWYMNSGYNAQVTPDQVRQMMMQFDPNFDGHITKPELHMAMVRMGSAPQQYVQSYQPIQNFQHQQRPTVIIIKGKNVNYQ